MEPEKIDALRQFMFASQRLELLYGMTITQLQSEWVATLVENSGVQRDQINMWLKKEVDDPTNGTDILIQSIMLYAATTLGAEL